MSQVALLDLPATTLLNKFGAGSHAPGSGSAAALMGILSSKLILTVAAISLRKPEYARDHAKIRFIVEKIESALEPRLRELFERDATAFDEVIKARIARDACSDEREKRRLGELALERLKNATEIPLEIGDRCLELLHHGVAVFDMGFRAARGDTGAAISAAVAGAMSAVFVVNLNLKSFRGSDWAVQQRKRCDSLHDLLARKQLEAFGRVMTLRTEEVASMDLRFGDEASSYNPTSDPPS